MKKFLLFFFLAVIGCQQLMAQRLLLETLKTEADRNLTELMKQPVPAYYISYRAYERTGHAIIASFGEVTRSAPFSQRTFNAAVRVGTPEMDNTRQLKESNERDYVYSNSSGLGFLTLGDNPAAWKMALWQKTDELYAEAAKRHEMVKVNTTVKVSSDDQSPDFSMEKAERYVEKPIHFSEVAFDPKLWEAKVQKYSAVFKENRDIIEATCSFQTELLHKYFVDTQGAEVFENRLVYQLTISAAVKADDGMDLPLFKGYFAYAPDDLPSDEQVIADANWMSKMLSELRVAPVAESYSGPVLMSGQAASVFFHEIFGHRIEGARLKNEADAQTFKNKTGQLVLPKDMSVIFDPQLKEAHGFPLNGFYVFDDEGVRGQRVEVVKNGVLHSFLMNRTPLDGFPHSNGHGRAAISYMTTTRQSNTMITSTRPKTEKELRSMMINQLKKEGKPYGYLIDQVSGGFTNTNRIQPNAFNVTPLLVFRIYTDGRPDEIVRGVDMVGTPLAMFSQIAACGKDYDVFNGMCGAESGGVPVASVSPSLYVKMVETQKKARSQSQPPILSRP